MSQKSGMIIEAEKIKSQMKTIAQEKEETMNKEQNKIRKE